MARPAALAAARLLAAMAVAAAAACSPQPVARTNTDEPLTLDPACERALQDLDILIAERVAEGSTPRDVIAEARALREAAVEVYLQGDSELALDLVDQAFELLGKGT
jgi:hypothetical protein